MVDKINFTNDKLLEKYEKLQEDLENLQSKKLEKILFNDKFFPYFKRTKDQNDTANSKKRLSTNNYERL